MHDMIVFFLGAFCGSVAIGIVVGGARKDPPKWDDGEK